MNTSIGRKIALSVSMVLLIALWAFSVIRWPDLPTKIPVHFGFYGRPNIWSQKSVLAWFGLPLVTSWITLLILFLTGFVVRYIPVSISYKEGDLRRQIVLDHEKGRTIYDLLFGIGLWMIAIINGWLLFLQYIIFEISAGTWTELPVYWTPGFISSLLVVTVLLLIPLIKSLNKLRNTSIS